MSIVGNLYQPVSTTVCNFIIIGCLEVSAQPQPGAIKPIIIQVGEHDPNGCKLLGKVKGSSRENPTDEDSTPSIERLINARNNLRHEAKKIGSDIVHIIYANNSGKYEIPGIDKEIIFIGNVCDCESTELN